MRSSKREKERVLLLPDHNRMLVESVAAAASHEPVVACDFYIVGAEMGESVTGGYRLGSILNVDHHAPTARMRRKISSATLALDRAEANLLAQDRAAKVMINHVDCDSILTAGIMAGLLPPDRRFSDAAIAADHTGEENPIADLLQGLDARQPRHGRDLNVSYRNLDRLLTGTTLEPFAREALDARLRERSSAEACVAAGAFSHAGPLSWAVLDEPIDGAFFPALLPQSAVILLMNRLPQDRARWQVKVRLGLQAPTGFALSDLQIDQFDPAYGGRWNAGSNRRGGGTVLQPKEYAAALVARLEGTLRHSTTDSPTGAAPANADGHTERL